LRLRLRIAGKWDDDGEEQAHRRASANLEAPSTFPIAPYQSEHTNGRSSHETKLTGSHRINLPEDYEVAYWSRNGASAMRNKPRR
jgi:hypothetical protein